MPTNITETRHPDTGRSILRVEGDLFLEDAIFLERIAKEMIEKDCDGLTIDLADLGFMDSESAGVLRRLIETDGITINGIEIFLQSAIDRAERSV
jgi:anti-anti-sigma regulatory factor